MKNVPVKKVSESDFQKIFAATSKKSLSFEENDRASAYSESRAVIEFNELIVGLKYHSHGVDPQAEYLSPTKALVGFGNNLICISIAAGQPLWEKTFSFLLIAFIQIDEKRMILVNYEIGVSAISNEGTLLWDAPISDIITDIQTDERVVKVKTLEGDHYAISLDSGKVFKI